VTIRKAGDRQARLIADAEAYSRKASMLRSGKFAGEKTARLGAGLGVANEHRVSGIVCEIEWFGDSDIYDAPGCPERSVHTTEDGITLRRRARLSLYYRRVTKLTHSLTRVGEVIVVRRTGDDKGQQQARNVGKWLG